MYHMLSYRGSMIASLKIIDKSILREIFILVVCIIASAIEACSSDKLRRILTLE